MLIRGLVFYVVGFFINVNLDIFLFILLRFIYCKSLLITF